MPTLTDNTSKLQALSQRLAGSIFVPGDEGYDENRGAFNVLVDQQPAAIALPADAADVSLVVRFAAEHDLKVAPQTTGHNAAPIADLENTILIRMGALNRVEIDVNRRRAIVGAGARWGDVTQKASDLGFAALHGSSPTVGIAGYSLGGGIGWYARKHGLQTNRLTAIEIVLADGNKARVNTDNHPDLFWALRGGGGNFGVVTALEFELFPLDEVYAGVLFFPWERSSEVLKAWREFTQTAPDEVTSVGRILQIPDMDGPPEFLRGRNFVVVEAAFLGSEEDGKDLLAPLRELGPEIDTFAMVPPAALADLHMDPEDPMPAASGHMLVGNLSEDAIDNLVAITGPGSDSPLVSIELRHTGGALGRVEEGSGALGKLAGEYAMFAVGVAPVPEAEAAINERVAMVKSVLAPWDEGHYLNFVEETVDTATVYSPTTYERLQSVRRSYDAGGLFVANHAVPA